MLKTRLFGRNISNANYRTVEQMGVEQVLVPRSLFHHPDIKPGETAVFPIMQTIANCVVSLTLTEQTNRMSSAATLEPSRRPTGCWTVGLLRNSSQGWSIWSQGSQGETMSQSSG